MICGVTGVRLEIPVTSVSKIKKESAAKGSQFMQVTLPAEKVPPFILQAYQATQAGDHEQAQILLNPVNIGHLATLSRNSDTYVSAMTVLGSTWRRLGRPMEAAQAFEEVRRVRPDAAVLHELTALYRETGQFGQALTVAEQAVKSWPRVPELQSLYAECLISLGRLEEGLAVLKQMIDSGQASAAVHNLYNWYLAYVPNMDRQGLYQAACAWAHRHTKSVTPLEPRTIEPETEHCLRIGYLSSDFRTHSVTYTFEPLLDGRDVQSFEVYGYGNVAHPDATTERLKGKFNCYRNVFGLDARAVAERIREDRIDILVSLAAHCSATNLLVLAHKPAPIQIDIGSLGSTGLAQVDYRVSDAGQDPPEVQAYYTEKLKTVAGGFIPYRPPQDAAPVGHLPMLTQGQVTFGCFANHLKINEEVVTCWADILRRIPRSRLLIKGSGGGDKQIKSLLTERFVAQGIASTRIRIEGWLSKQAHWDLYNQVDIALDTFPFNGGLTNIEALWMGVPTVTLAGDTFVSRTGLAILTQVGLPQMVAKSSPDMVAKAVALAHNPESLARVRANLRAAVAASPMCDVTRLARGLEGIYREVWAKLIIDK